MEKQIIFVADLFAEQYAGGAELTTDALIESSPTLVKKVHAKNLTVEFLQQNVDAFWIFGNFSSINWSLIPIIAANLRYAVLEYDYKFCLHRSIEKHTHETGRECDCHNRQLGQMVAGFYHAADAIFWMSEQQRARYTERFPNLLGHRNSHVLSSVFDDRFFEKVSQLKNKENDRSGWIVLGSKSWIKGYEDAVKWCEENGKQFQSYWDVPYEDLLDIMSRSEGFVYLPRGGDTCPRMVIEAKLLGCDVITNDNVQHAAEKWWNANPDEVCDYLKGRPDMFWGVINSVIQQQQTLSGYSTTYNCVEQNYPFVESITSLLDVCDEVVVVDGGSTDGTWDVLTAMADENPKLKIKQIERDWTHPRHAIFDGMQKAAARDLCTGDFCWQQDVDEVIHENDYQKIRNLLSSTPKSVNLICLPVVEFWGNKGKIRIDINPWKWRLSRNHPEITHGIPASLRRYDENGDLYSAPGSDGCDYVTRSTGDLVPNVNFHTQQTEQLRQSAQINSTAREQYVNWLTAVIQNLPGVYHYSWFDLQRKINTYRNYWTKHWQSMYNIKQEDTAANNMFFDKPWSEVTDDEIKEISDRLEKEMGGWIFHRKIDWNNPTPSAMIDVVKHPDVMNDWTGNDRE
jgi:glycosyltransferase involved in cell wall biosynthesis